MHLSPSRISRARRADIREFFEEGRLATIQQIARRFFPSDTPETARKKASRWLNKERRRGRIRIRGIVNLRGVGRPQLVYGKRRCNEDQLEHEVWITEAEWLLGGRFKRNVRVGKTFADAFFVRHGSRLF